MSTASIDPVCTGALTKGYTLRRWFTGCFLVVALSACSTLSSTNTVTVDRDRSIALLPFENLSATPQADARLQRLVETRLRHRGIQDIRMYESTQTATLNALLDSRSQMDEATRRASVDGMRYGFTGTVHEWQYKSGADREPVVGVTLSLIDLSRGDVLWQANAARSGWGYASLSAIAERVVTDLLEQVTFSDRQRTASLSQADR